MNNSHPLLYSEVGSVRLVRYLPAADTCIGGTETAAGPADRMHMQYVAQRVNIL